MSFALFWVLANLRASNRAGNNTRVITCIDFHPDSLARISTKNRASKAAIYAEAFKRFLSEDRELTQIADDLGLRADTLVMLAQNQRWFERRTTLRASRTLAESTERAHAVTVVDSKLVQNAIGHVDQLTTGWSEVIKKVLTLTDTPTRLEGESDRDYDRAKAIALERKADLMRKASAGFKEMTEVAQTLGLIRTPSKEDEKGAKLDLSKLTQLNIVLQEARKEVGVIEIGDADDLI